VKVVYLVIDGAAGNPAVEKTALQEAHKPNLDTIARKGRCGLVYTVERGVAPESDVAVLSILGYDPQVYYTGRGPLEALGVGLELKEGWEIALRGNFATVDPSTLEIVDRRAGRRIGGEEGARLASAIDGMQLDNGNGYAKVRHTIGHRVVVVIGHKHHKLSYMITNTDPAYVRRGLISEAAPVYVNKIAEASPLEATKEVAVACRLVNEFTNKAIEVLSKHPVNEARRKQGLPEANAVLLRDAGGKMPRLPPIERIFKPGLRYAALAEMPVEIGIASAAGFKVVSAPPPTGNVKQDYEIRASLTLKALEEADFVYVHIKGPDEPGHDGNCSEKRRIIEEIDRHFVGRLLDEGDNLAFIITSDHATPCYLKAHSSDPVPLVVYCEGIAPDGVQRFDEESCKHGSLGVLESGTRILPLASKLILEGCVE